MFDCSLQLYNYTCRNREKLSEKWKRKKKKLVEYLEREVQINNNLLVLHQSYDKKHERRDKSNKSHKVVVLAAPLWPRRQVICPLYMSRLMLFNAFFLPQYLVRFLIEIPTSRSSGETSKRESGKKEKHYFYAYIKFQISYNQMIHRQNFIFMCKKRFLMQNIIPSPFKSSNINIMSNIIKTIKEQNYQRIHQRKLKSKLQHSRGKRRCSYKEAIPCYYHFKSKMMNKKTHQIYWMVHSCLVLYPGSFP